MHVLELGGSHVTAAKVVVGADHGEVTDRITIPLDPASAREPLLEAMTAPGRALAAADLDRRYAGRHDDGPADWVVALPGPFDYARGIGEFAGVGKFGAVAGVDLRAEFARRLGADPARVLFLNDADAYGLGEWAFGVAGRAPRLVCITLGTGIGSAFIADGTAVQGGDDVPPDASVHMLEIDGRPLEDVVSTRAIVGAFEHRTGRRSTVKAIASSAAAGDPIAIEVLAACMRTLGRTLAPWLARFDASALVVGGSMSRSWRVVGEPLRAGLAEAWLASHPLPVVHASTLLDTAPLLGAADWLVRAHPSPLTDQESR